MHGRNQTSDHFEVLPLTPQEYPYPTELGAIP